MDSLWRIEDEVNAALEDGRGVVALETAVLTHGLPYPDNLETMHRMAQAVRQAGAVPAVMGILRGRPVVGLTLGDWEALLDRPEKCSIRDIGLAVSRGVNGGTTVALTAYMAHQVGISVFATGGIGGVHRGAEKTWDVSTDLYLLAQVPITVVSAGAKSILDLPKTAEFLESLGIPVLGFQTDELPGFYVRTTGLPVTGRVDQVSEVIAVRQAMNRAHLSQALLVVQPGPQSVSPALVDRLIDEALHEADMHGVRGKATTPYLLGYLNERAGDQLKAANIALLIANAGLAGAIAAYHA